MVIAHNYMKLQLMIFPINTSWGPVWFAQQKENKRRDRKRRTKNLWFGFSIPRSLSLSLQTVKVIGFTRPSLFFASKWDIHHHLSPSLIFIINQTRKSAVLAITSSILQSNSPKIDILHWSSWWLHCQVWPSQVGHWLCRSILHKILVLHS